MFDKCEKFRLSGDALVNWRFNENDIAFGIVGIDEIERIHRELAYACAELGANRFGHRFRANITGGFNCVEDVEDYFLKRNGRYSWACFPLPFPFPWP